MEHFPHPPPFVERIHQSSVDTPKTDSKWHFGISFVVKQQKHANKQSCRR